MAKLSCLDNHRVCSSGERRGQVVLSGTHKIDRRVTWAEGWDSGRTSTCVNTYKPRTRFPSTIAHTDVGHNDGNIKRPRRTLLGINAANTCQYTARQLTSRLEAPYK